MAKLFLRNWSLRAVVGGLGVWKEMVVVVVVIVFLQGSGLPVKMSWGWKEMRMGRVVCSFRGRSIRGREDFSSFTYATNNLPLLA